MKIKLTLLLGLFAASSYSQVQTTPTLQALADSIKQYHPQIQAMIAKRKQAGFAELEAQGAFDANISQTTQLRLSGYYDGQYLEQTISQPLQMMNAEIFGTYRISDGNFPDYDGYNETLSGGEANVGVSFSLLQNRDTDARRVGLSNAEQTLKNWQAQEHNYLNTLLNKGLNTYLNWYQEALQAQVINHLVQTTQLRLSAIKQRVEKGDLARISLTEFQTTLLQRQILQQQAQRNLVITKQSLSYFWRDNSGEMHSADQISDLPKQINWPLSLEKSMSAQIDRNIAQHPQIKALRAKRVIARNKMSLADNKLLPTLDVKFSVAQDFGHGTESLYGTESKVALNFSVPLGQRTAKAQRGAARQKIRELDYALKALADQLQQAQQQAWQALHFAKSLAELRKKQAQVADQLWHQELTRFEAGDSDLFLLNNREATAIEAKLSAIRADVSVYRQELQIWTASGLLRNQI